jgi:hypothetical protein
VDMEFQFPGRVGDITLRLDILISYGAVRDKIRTKVGKNLLFSREMKCQKMEMFYPICEMKSEKSDFMLTQRSRKLGR